MHHHSISKECYEKRNTNAHRWNGINWTTSIVHHQPMETSSTTAMIIHCQRQQRWTLISMKMTICHRPLHRVKNQFHPNGHYHLVRALCSAEKMLFTISEPIFKRKSTRVSYSRATQLNCNFLIFIYLFYSILKCIPIVYVLFK